MKQIIKSESPNEFEIWKNKEMPQAWNMLPGKLPDHNEVGINYYSKDQLRLSLLDEQNSKCLYCESKIENDALKTRIDHVKIPQSIDNEAIFDYSNLGLSCDGGEKQKGNSRIKKESLHCDVYKQDKLLPFTPYDEKCENEIEFSIDGYVRPLTNEGNVVCFILNLNCSRLRNRRRNAIEGYIGNTTNLISVNEAKKLYDILTQMPKELHLKALLDTIRLLF